MIKPGEKVLIAVSGNKDSLALSLALTARRRWVPCELHAVHVEWDEYPMTGAERDTIDAFFDGIELPLRRVRARMAPPSFRQKFGCYTCSRNRKRILFDEVGRLGARTIALGYHMDDIARTTRVDRHAVSNVYGAPWRRNEDYLPRLRAQRRDAAREPDAGVPEPDAGVPEPDAPVPDTPERWL